MTVKEVKPPVKNKIVGVFNENELEFFKSNHEGIILYTREGVPFIDYLKAKEVFESVTGSDYTHKIIESKFYPEFNTFYLHVRFIVERNGFSFEKDVMASAKGSFREGQTDIFNFDDLGKSAMKDAMKKFFSDYMGIGLKALHDAKEEAKKENKEISVDNLKCSNCNIEIDEQVYKFSTKYFTAKRPLCRNCQDKYKKGELK